MLLLSGVLPVVAQKTIISGVVRSSDTGDPLAQVSVQAVAASGDNGAETVGGEAVVTNDDGLFTLKSDRQVAAIIVSHIGYRTQRIPVGGSTDAPVTIRLVPATVQLQGITVWTGNPRELVSLAIKKIPSNYSTVAELSNCFYRETAMKRQHYIYVAEGVVDMFKTAYDRPSFRRDRVAIRKGRRLLSPRRGDTLTVKVMGGPVQAVQLDVVKQTELLLNEEDLNLYNMEMLSPQVIADRQQFVVELSPRSNANVDYALYNARLYIDCETLSFTRAELQLDVSDRERASRVMLIRKPAGLRFRPRELSLVADYRTDDDGVTRLSYVRTCFRFNCDWRRKLFATSFTAPCEMVATAHESKPGVQPISGRQSFDSRDAFYDKVDYFRDPDFWKDYNIIEPTESLDRAVGRLLRRYPPKQ